LRPSVSRHRINSIRQIAVIHSIFLHVLLTDS
jgi:hypothetical protein